MNEAARYDLVIEQGSFFSFTFTWKDGDGNPIDNTGYTFKLQAKKPGSSTLVIDLNSVSGITLGGSSGTVTASMDDATTAALDFNIASYNLEAVPPSGHGQRLLKGFITLDRDIES